jgi:3-dehydroquinate synthase
MRLTLNTGPGKAAGIYTGSTVFQELNTFLGNLSPGPDSIFILTDKQSRSCCLEVLTCAVSSLLAAEVLEIPAGEKNKSLKSAEHLWNILAFKGASRRSLLINLGGGVITDLGGFVASTFKRGIPFIHIPTSLLGMVDAAIGGKTGINLGDIKNQIGTFQNPEAIFISTGFLGTLDSYELLSGFAEIIKIALVADICLWKKLGSIRLQDLLKMKPDKEIWEDLISASVAIKCRIVEQDFREKNLREILNFGHTIGHAFESLSLQTNRNPLSHGHAIALGMICESYLSVMKSGLDSGDRDAIIRMIFPDYEYYPLHRKDLDFMMEFIEYDKKRRSSGACFSLLRSPGNAISGERCEPGEIIESIDFYRALER